MDKIMQALLEGGTKLIAAAVAALIRSGVVVMLLALFLSGSMYLNWVFFGLADEQKSICAEKLERMEANFERKLSEFETRLSRCDSLRHELAIQVAVLNLKNKRK